MLISSSQRQGRQSTGPPGELTEVRTSLGGTCQASVPQDKSHNSHKKEPPPGQGDLARWLLRCRRRCSDSRGPSSVTQACWVASTPALVTTSPGVRPATAITVVALAPEWLPPGTGTNLEPSEGPRETVQTRREIQRWRCVPKATYRCDRRAGTGPRPPTVPQSPARPGSSCWVSSLAPHCCTWGDTVATCPTLPQAGGTSPQGPSC